MSLQTLLNDLDAVLRRILDTDLLLITSLLKKSLVTLSQDPLRLASEILARLRPLQGKFLIQSRIFFQIIWLNKKKLIQNR